jgi:phage tail sheath protein FI
MTGGIDSLTAGSGDYFTEGSRGYGLFAGEGDDVAIVIAGQPGGASGECATVIGNLVDQADKDKDFMVFFSPFVDDVVGPTAGAAKDNVIAFKNLVNKNSSYAAMDSGYKKMFDKFNDQFVNVPLNADIAGCVARSEDVADAWFSPAGFSRGQVRGAVSLPFNPSESLRDELYRNGINPVVSFPGEGTVLFGDKTLLTRPSAFDRINVRRLFIVLEKAISTAAKFSLFEFNDSFTRSQFRNLVEPFLRDVKGRRGITDFKVVCDDSNNPASVIDRNEFVADIFVKPNRSINFITLSFIATGTGVAFEEVQDAFA